MTGDPKGGWTIVALLFGFMMINFADKAIIGLAGVPIMAELQLTPKQFGLVGSSFFFLFSISAVAVGFIVNRVQSRIMLLIMGLVWALVQFPLAGSVSIELLIACRIVLGAGEGPAYPVALHAVYKWFPDARRAVPGAVIAQGSALGVIVAIPTLSWVIAHYNWHYAFAALGAAGLLWVITWSILGKEGTLGEPAGTPYSAFVPYRILLFNGTNIGCWCAGFGAYFCLAQGLSWFTPFLMTALGFSQTGAGQLTAAVFVTGSLIVFAGSWVSQDLIRRGVGSRLARGVLCGGAIAIGGVCLIVSWTVQGEDAKLLLIIAGSTLPSIVYPIAPVILAEISPAGQRGAMLAINTAVSTLAGIVAPYAMGSAIQDAATPAEGYAFGYLVCGCVALAGGILGVLLLRPEAQRLRFATSRGL